MQGSNKCVSMRKFTGDEFKEDNFNKFSHNKNKNRLGRVKTNKPEHKRYEEES